jgi:hypothetical protein
MTQYEVTFKYITEDGTKSSMTMVSNQWWDRCHEQNERFIKKNFTDKGIKLHHFEIINTSSYEIRDTDF